MNNTKDLTHWLHLLGEHMKQFKLTPTDATRTTLTKTMHEYREAVSASGLNPPRIVPPVWKLAKDFSEWMRLQLDDALLMFETCPTVGRYGSLCDLLREYRDGVATGKVKP